MLRRLWLVWAVLGLVVAACGSEDGEAFTTTSPTPGITVGEVTTTAPWGEAVAPGVEAMVEGSRVLLREDFQDGYAAGWVVEAGWYVLQNGERRMAAAGGQAWAWYGEGLNWSRYGMRLAFIVNGGSLGVSVAVGEGGRYLVLFSPEGVHLLKDAPYGSVQALGSAQPVELGVPHVLAVGLDGGHLQVYVDGVLLIDSTDRSPLPGGSVGLSAADGSSVAVDNLVVASLGGPLPEIEAVAESADDPLPDSLADGAPQAGEQLGSEEPPEPGFPNLVLTAVSVPAEVALGEPFDVSMTVASTGEADAGPFRVMFSTEWEEACGEDRSGLAAGEEITVTCEMSGAPDDLQGSFEWRAGADWWGEVDEGAREDDNAVAGTTSLSQGDVVEVLPDVAISWAERVPVDPAPGDAITISFGVSQTNPEWSGRLPALEFVVLQGGSTVCRTTVPAGHTSGECEIPGFAEPGEYALQLVIDAGDVLAESDEDDNSAFRSIIVADPGPDLPNLFLDYFKHPSVTPAAGEPFTVVIGVWADPADAVLSLYTVRALVDDVVVCSMDVDFHNLGVVCDVPGLAAGTHEFAVYIDADDDIAESDETDNDAYAQIVVRG